MNIDSELMCSQQNLQIWYDLRFEKIMVGEEGNTVYKTQNHVLSAWCFVFF